MSVDECSGSFFSGISIVKETGMNNDKTANKGVFDAEVISNHQIRGCYYRLDMQLDAKGSDFFRDVTPGQFLELDLSGVSVPNIADIPNSLRDSSQRSVLLRRPFSFSDVSVTRSAKGICTRVQILYCVLGAGSVRMSNLKCGDIVSVLGPLGNGFLIPDGLSQAVIIGGGMGSPPILHLADYLKQYHPDCQIACFVGAKSCEDFPFTLLMDNERGFVLEEFERIRVPAQTATDDGSAGYRGFVTDLVRHWLKENKTAPDSTVIFGCGPEAMLAATAQLAKEFQLPCQVSMERMMACGIGLCQSCAVEVGDAKKYHLCCKDGPVFNADEVVWQID
jgi:dihydroorotate dehydrogenase electron transfer subunit